MYLIIDIGNTRVKLAGFDQKNQIVLESAIELEKIKSNPLIPPAEQIKINSADIQGILIASVVPDIEKIVSDQLSQISDQSKITWVNRDKNNIEPLKKQLSSIVDTSIYPDNILGADRLLNLIGAKQLFSHQNNLIIDLGTTTKIDGLRNDSTFTGGIITPGARAFESCIHQAALLQNKINIFTSPKSFPGVDTQSCIESGLHEGYDSLLNGLIQKSLQHLNWQQETTNLIITGGDAVSSKPWFKQCQFKSITTEPHLTLMGGLALLKALYSPQMDTCLVN